ncbi:tryptophan halogenase family protein [Paraglaciecola sp.]|uniref:tryptophan halogenase family protein n=1 Tax=Paraglaciecola sp. TaxID=1920173 RepID=UPI003EF77DD6
MKQPYEIVIVGGGTAGWMFAIAASALYRSSQLKITLIESEQIGSVGVGEATLPQLKDFNEYVGIDEKEMMTKTNATFKLGIRFDDWGKLGNSYYHPFGQYGDGSNGEDIHQYWARLQSESDIPDLQSLSYAAQLCTHKKFTIPSQNNSSFAGNYAYAYHFDASLYAQFLRETCEKRGVNRIEGMIEHVIRDPQSGDISSLRLKDGQEIHGNFFIDCSGFRSLLLKQSLEAKFEDWSKWLLCDRAVALPSEKLPNVPNYTLSTAKQAGWQWQIPLQHRTGNGYVYCSEFISDDEAITSIQNNIRGEALAAPKVLKFQAGRYQQSWNKNCLAVGLASGFLEPLESTSIYLIQMAITSFLRLFPLNNDALIAKEYNREMDNEYDRIRDFLILHYHLNQRDDGELWRYCRDMSVPDSLLEKLALFEQRGYVDTYKYGLFNLPSWISILHGQGAKQQHIEPFAQAIPKAKLAENLKTFAANIQQHIKTLPDHEQFILQHCPANKK